MGLSIFSKQELLDEVARKDKLGATIPPSLGSIDTKALENKIVEYIQAVADGQLEDDQFPISIFQLAVEAKFGDSIWEWISVKREPARAAQMTKEAQARADLLEKAQVEFRARGLERAQEKSAAQQEALVRAESLATETIVDRRK